jgi:hypothetical protein
MKIKILFISLLMLLGGSLQAQDGFLDSLGNIESAIERNLGFDTATTGLDATLIPEKIRMAFALLAPVLSARPIRDTIFTLREQSDYTLDSQMVEVKKVFLHHADTFLGMTFLPIDEWDKIPGYKAGYTLRGKVRILSHSTHFDWVPGRITLYPVPYNVGDTIIIDGTAIADNIMSDDGFPGDFKVSYRTLITLFATSLTAQALDRDDDAAYYYQLFKDFAGTLGITIGAGIKSNDA